MTRFVVGDQVVIRFGKQQGQKALIIKCQPANVYSVRAEDGSVLYFTGKGLESENSKSSLECVGTSLATVGQHPISGKL